MGQKGWTFTELAKVAQKLEWFEKASRWGTASRKNRFKEQIRIRRRLIVKCLTVRACERAFRAGRWTS
jgi:hypothetical protein